MKEEAVYVLVRRDLGMRRGKEIAQGIHAVGGLGYHPGLPVIVLQAQDEQHMIDIANEAHAWKVPIHMVHDAGKTEVEPGTCTALAVGPVVKGYLPLLMVATLY